MQAYPALPDFQGRKRKSLDSESSLESREIPRNELQVVEVCSFGLFSIVNINLIVVSATRQVLCCH